MGIEIDDVRLYVVEIKRKIVVVARSCDEAKKYATEEHQTGIIGADDDPSVTVVDMDALPDGWVGDCLPYGPRALIREVELIAGKRDLDIDGWLGLIENRPVPEDPNQLKMWGEMWGEE